MILLNRGYLIALFGFIFIIHPIKGNVTLKPNYSDVTIEIENVNNSMLLTATRGDDVRYIGSIGTTLQMTYESWASNNFVVFDFENDTRLEISVEVFTERYQVNVRWSAPNTVRLQDCFKLDPYDWFGGPEQKKQNWPVQTNVWDEYSFVNKEEENHSVAEPYWLNSIGTFIYVHKEVPLFIDQNNIMDNHLCVISDVKSPYSTQRTHSELSYDIVINKDAKVGHQHAVEQYLGKPRGSPDFRMMEHPIWSTWARYARPINQTLIIEFANEILSYGYNNSQMEIDDLWEVCYGSLTIDTNKFPDFRGLINDLKDLGFRSAMWIHPFINENCEPWFTTALENGYLIKNEEGSVYTSWWNSNSINASHVDFTNPDARDWWIKRVMSIQAATGIDSFKFDAGESGWTPQVPVQTGDIRLHPGHITNDFVRAVSKFGPMIEVRSAERTQDLPVFVRMVDKDSLWSTNNGLPTLVTTLLQMNMVGYPLVIPDMIGGNGANLENGEKPSKELFIRWLQANTFMPVLQFSFVPWDFDNETIEICLKYTNLHAKYAVVIQEKINDAVKFGTPVNPPIWWADPTDEEALGIGTEYFLGEDILIAPVLEENAVSRDIYLPAGLWTYAEEDTVYEGKEWYYNFSAPLDTLPYFKRVHNTNGAISMTPLNIITVIFVPFFIYIMK